MFLSRLERAAERSGSWLCVGLDPRPNQIPQNYGPTARGLLRYCEQLVESTEASAAAYKANLGFFLTWGPPGLKVLERLTAYIHQHTEAPVILDAKWGDIASTAQAYAFAAQSVGVDALTCTVYMGADAVIPFVERGLYTFVLTLPSNPASHYMVDHGSPPNYLRVAGLAAEVERDFRGLVGLVVGATRLKAAAQVYRAAGQLMWLVPGVGAQGGDLREMLKVAPHQRMLINVSRAVAGAPEPGKAAQDFAERIRVVKESG